MSYIFNMLICVGMILLNNLLQCLLFIAMIDLSITYGNTATLIYTTLVMIIIYSWIKIKLKVLIFPTESTAGFGASMYPFHQNEPILWIWSSRCSNKLQIFTWSVMLDRLNTRNLTPHENPQDSK
jgi:hypothetical protein